MDNVRFSADTVARHSQVLSDLRETPRARENSKASHDKRTPGMDITYCSDSKITVAAAIDLYRRSTLGERRPVDRPDIFAGMLNNADLIISAWHDERLVGIARSLTDFSYVAYLADLAVDIDYQKNGIGKRLVQETKQRLGRQCMVVLLAAPNANEYYPKLGFEHNPRAWVLKGG